MLQVVTIVNFLQQLLQVFVIAANCYNCCKLFYRNPQSNA